MTRREIWRFLAVTFAAGFALQLLAIGQGVHGNGRNWLMLVMWAPAAGALSSRAARAAAKAALKKCGLGWIGTALAVGWSLTLVQTALLWLSGGGRWNSEQFARGPHGIEGVHKVAMVLGVGAQGFGFFALNIFLSITLGSLITGLIGGLGEELGWRAVLQPELERRWGAARGSLAAGLIWAYWHVPVNLAGYNDPVHPLWNTLVFFPLVVTAMAFSFGWLTRRTGSVWPAAMAHGANNVIGSGFLLAPTAWAWDTGTMLIAAALVGGFFALRAWRRGPAIAGAGLAAA